jgi:hypothetical protein
VIYLRPVVEAFGARSSETHELRPLRADIMTGTSFLRHVPLHRLRKSITSPQVDGPQPVISEQSGGQVPVVPRTQTVLLLHAAKQPYVLTDSYSVPPLQEISEVLVRTQVIGLNPIDWKAP